VRPPVCACWSAGGRPTISSPHTSLRGPLVRRGTRSLLDEYRSRGARALIEKARSAAAQILVPPPPATRPATRPVLPSALIPKTTGPKAADEAKQADDALAGMCAGVALRDLNLVDSLLAHLEKMEAGEENPDRLAELYKIDHLATRLRRNAENLRVLAGRDAGGSSDETASLVDVIRAALSSIEQYTRVEIGRIAALAVVGFAADDVSRLLAELLDNATAQSPPTSAVSVSAHLTEQGSVLLRIEDAGIGIPAKRLEELNDRLSAAPTLDRKTMDHMGLAVVRRLAARHDIRVWLGKRAPHGTTASVLLPGELVREAAPTPWVRPQGSISGTITTAPTPARNEADTTPTTTNGLPRRDAGPRHQARSAGQEVAVTTTTANGLPRRVPRSLRGTPPVAEERSGAEDTADRSGHDQLLADLDAFSEGEQAAREDRETLAGQEERAGGQDG
jgi:signal transduction histidine kinase